MPHSSVLATIFEQESAALMATAPWLATPAQFEKFLRTYHDKIRRKARLSHSLESRLDLLAELAVAWLLVRDRQFAVEYEKPLPNRRGGPDFTATFKTHTIVNVEVRHLRSGENTSSDGGTRGNKWAYAVCDKVRQLPVTGFNTIALVVDETMSVEDLAPVMKQLKLHAERKDEAYFNQRGLSVPDFFTYYGRLHAIVVCGYASDIPRMRASWFNKEARRVLPPDLQRTLSVLGRRV